MRLEFHPEALAEYEFAVTYYEQHQVGLGNRFLASVEYALQSILTAPMTCPSSIRMFVAASPGFFPTQFSTRSSATTFLFWQ